MPLPPTSGACLFSKGESRSDGISTLSRSRSPSSQTSWAAPDPHNSSNVWAPWTDCLRARSRSRSRSPPPPRQAEATASEVAEAQLQSITSQYDLFDTTLASCKIRYPDLDGTMLIAQLRRLYVVKSGVTLQWYTSTGRRALFRHDRGKWERGHQPTSQLASKLVGRLPGGVGSYGRISREHISVSRRVNPHTGKVSVFD